MSIRQRAIGRLDSEALIGITRSEESTQKRRPFSKLPFFFFLIGCGTVLWLYRHSQLPLPSRTLKSFEYGIYRHLNHSEPLELREGTKILHVAKEFGPAIMGGLGVMLTALAIAQSNSSLLDISVVLPHYSYLRDLPESESRHYISLPVAIYERGRPKNVMVEINKLKWNYTSVTDCLNPLPILPSSSPHKSITIYLIGPGDQSPFNVAFQIKNPQEIYSAKKPLPQEWKDLWFAKSTAGLINYMNSIGERVDLVQLHGATNAMVPYFLQKYDNVPAIVYTLHDSLDEVEYTNLVENVKIFLDPVSTTVAHPRGIKYDATEFSHLDLSSSLQSLEPWIHFERFKSWPFLRNDNRQLFTSGLGIDLSDQVTFVSKSIAKDIVEGRFRFKLEGLVMPSLLHRAELGDFTGVTNGLDFSNEMKNPFVNRNLLKLNLNFQSKGNNLGNKLAAKQLLINKLPNRFNSSDIHSPFLLFIGRFQFNKGCQFFEPILSLLAQGEYTARLVVVGTPNNYPIQKLKTLEKLYPNQFTLIDDWETQSEWISVLRMAADYSFVPSFSEAFGLVAAEGLFFGSSVISSGVGGLVEFLVPYPRDNPFSALKSNAFLFDLFPNRLEDSDLTISAEKSRPNDIELAPGIASCLEAVKRAIVAWQESQKLSLEERNELIERKIEMALALEWNRENGPIDEYNQVYSRAIKIRAAI